MSYYDVLFHPDIISATFFYMVLAIGFEIIYNHLLIKISHEPGSHWIARQIIGPFVHVLLLIAYIYICYPVIFGLQEAPALSELLDKSHGRTMKLINIVFAVSVILPLLPVIGRFSALILPLQAITASAVIYSWLSEAMSRNYTIIPGAGTLLLIIILSFITSVVATWLDGYFSPTLNEKYQTEGWGRIIQRSTIMLFQVPILLVYTLNLT
jgi:hypothetical protein